MIGLPVVYSGLGIAGVILGVAVLQERPSHSVLGSLLIGAAFCLWLLFWLASLSIALANADALSEIFEGDSAPQQVTLAAALLSWLVTVLIARSLSMLRPARVKLTGALGIIVGLAWASVLLAPFVVPWGIDAPRAEPSLVVLTVVLAAGFAPAPRL